jgi:hypothetical protein
LLLISKPLTPIYFDCLIVWLCLDIKMKTNIYTMVSGFYLFPIFFLHFLWPNGWKKCNEKIYYTTCQYSFFWVAVTIRLNFHFVFRFMCIGGWWKFSILEWIKNMMPNYGIIVACRKKMLCFPATYFCMISAIKEAYTIVMIITTGNVSVWSQNLILFTTQEAFPAITYF